jgi:hypothetical protein
MSEYEDYESYEVINTEDLNKVEKAISEAEVKIGPSSQPSVKIPGVKATPSVKTELEPIKININSIPEHDAWADYAIFFPLANKLKDSIIELEISPMLITVFGSLLRVLVMYYIYNNEPYYATAAYLFAYIFDCIDEKSSDRFHERMVFSFVTNLIIGGMLIHKYGFTDYHGIIILVLIIMLILNFGLEEAIISNSINGNDNFLLRRQKEIGNSTNIIDKLFLVLTNISYVFYRSIFPNFNKDKISNWSKVIKEFGPGNFTLAMLYIIFNL